MKKLGLLVLISVFLSACGAVNKCVCGGDIDSEEYKVYSDFLDLKGESAEKGVKFYKEDAIEILIDSKTSHDIEYINRETLEKEVVEGRKLVKDDRLFQDYIEKNLKSNELSDNFTIPVKYKLVKFDEYMKVVETDYFQKNPKVEGLFMLKRVGFNEKKDLAIMYIRRFYRHQSAYGEIFIMEKKEGKWVTNENIRTWKE